MKSTTIRVAIFAVIGAIFLFGVTSTGLQAADNKTTSKPVTIRFSWWGGDTRHQKTLEAIALYMKKNPHVTIEAEYSGFSGYYQKLVTQLASGNAPDVFQSDQGWTSEFFQRGEVFADLKKYADVIDTSKFNPTLLTDYCTLDNQLVVMPLGFNGTIFLYNKDLMKPYLKNGQLDLTWTDFIAIGKDLHTKDNSAYLTTNITDGYIRFMLKPILEQVTNQISVKDDYTIGFTKTEMTKTFDLIGKIFDDGAAQPYAESVIYKDSILDNPKWKNGKIGGAFIFFSNIDRETRGLPYNFDVARLPELAGAKTSGQETGPSLMIALNKKSNAKDEAAKFIGWFLNDPEAAAILATERGVPANSDSLQVLKKAEKLSPLMAKAVEISNKTMGFKNGAFEMNASVHAIFVEKMEKLIFKKLSPEKAAEELINDLTKRLAEMKGN